MILQGVAASGAGYPPKVKEQVDQLLAVEYNSRTVPVIGPKFDKNTDDKTVAADFIAGTKITLTPVPAPGLGFAGWDSSCAAAGVGPCELPVGDGADASAA